MKKQEFLTLIEFIFGLSVLLDCIQIRRQKQAIIS